jgi:hypothetical protein
MGYSREHDLHRWLLRIWALRAAWGSPAELSAELGAALGLHAHDPGQMLRANPDERITADA